MISFFISPGSGPSAEARTKHWYRTTFIAQSHSIPNAKVTASITGGNAYEDTAKIACESALCLINDINKLTAKGGVLTPAVAFGSLLIERLNKTGSINFTLHKYNV